MKKNSIFKNCLQICLCVPLFGNAQTPLSTEKGNVLSEIFILSGSASGKSTVFNVQDLRSMLPESSLLKENLTDFKSSGDGIWNKHSYFGIQLGAVADKSRRESGKGSPLLRFGISYESGDYMNTFLSNESSFRFDTLYNTQGQIVYLRDSTREDHCNISFSSSIINAEFSVLLRTNTGRRWMFYAGAGMSAGISFNNLYQVERYTINYLEEYLITETNNNNSSSPSKREKADFTSENIQGKSSWVFNGFIPLGINFRIGKKSEFLKNFHLFSEFRPGVRVLDIQEGSTITGSYLLGTFGLRTVWK